MNAPAPESIRSADTGGTFACKHPLCGGVSGYGSIALNGYMSAVWCECCQARHHLLVGQLPGQPMLIVAGGLWPETGAVGPRQPELAQASAG